MNREYPEGKRVGCSNPVSSTKLGLYGRPDGAKNRVVIRRYSVPRTQEPTNTAGNAGDRPASPQWGE